MGRILGSVMRHTRCHGPAPSSLAASYSSGGTEESAAIENGPPAQFLPDVCNDDDGNEPVGIGQYARTRAQPGAQKPLFVQKRVGDGVNDDPTEKVRDIDDRLHHFLRVHHAHIVQKDGQKQGRGRRADEF